MFSEFRQFIMRGNVIDLAVGVVIGAAFTKIVTALVEKIIMPIVGVLIGGVDISKQDISVGDAHIGYGAVLQESLNFLIVAFVLFLIVKAFNNATNSNVGIQIPAHDAGGHEAGGNEGGGH